MKIFKRLVFFFGLVAGCLFLVAGENPIVSENVPLGVTSLAATSTNTTAGTVYTFPTTGTGRSFTLTARAVGDAATTNGTLVLKFATSTDGTNFTSTAQATIKLTFTEVTSSTNYVSDWFIMPGAHYLKHVSTENTFQGAVTNLQVKAAY